MLLSGIGFIISFFLMIQYMRPAPVECIVHSGFNSCEAVRLSMYSTLLGVQLPVWGSLFFLALTGYLVLPAVVKLSKKKLLLYYKLMFLPLVGALVFEAYLTYIQHFEIGAFCIWCSGIQLVIILLFLLYTLWWVRVGRYQFSEVTESPR